MAIGSLVQAGSGVATGTSVSLAFTSANTAGNTILVGFQSTKTSTPSVPTDTQGNTYTQMGTTYQDPATSNQLSFYVALNVKAGANTVTATAASGSGDRSINIAEFPGVALTSALDHANAGETTSSSATPSCAPITTTAAGDLVAVLCLPFDTLSARSGYSVATEENTTTGLGIFYQVVGAAGSYTPTITQASAGTMVAITVALKAAASTAHPATAAATVTASASVAGTHNGAHSAVASGTVHASAVAGPNSSRGKAVSATVTATASTPGTLPAPFVTATSGKHFVDQYGHPIFAHMEVAWFIHGEPSTSWPTYFASRQSYGVNTVAIGNTPSNDPSDPVCRGDGSHALTTPGDFSSWNPTYVARVQAFVDLAASYGITVLFSGAEPDMYSSTANATASGDVWGPALGGRPNVLWGMGVDYESTDWTADNPNFRAYQQAVQASAPSSLWTLENYRNQTSSDNTFWVGKLQFEGLYTYQACYDLAYNAYNTGTGPVVMVESNWEGENNENGPATVPETFRRTLGWLVTSGAVGGDNYGNHNIWDPSNAGAGLAWEADLPSTSLAHLQTMVAAVTGAAGWHLLVPDHANAFLVSGEGTKPTTGTQNGSLIDPLESTYATAAVTPDKSLAVVYNPDTTVNTALTLSASAIGGSPTITRVDPTNGATTSLGWTTTPTGGANAAGQHDWLFIVTATSSKPATASATVTATGHAGAVHQRPASVSATVTATSTAAAFRSRVGAITSTVTALASAAASRIRSASTGATVTATATATPVHIRPATASATVTATASAAGTASGQNSAVAAATVRATAAAAGSTNRTASAGATVQATAAVAGSSSGHHAAAASAVVQAIGAAVTVSRRAAATLATVVARAFANPEGAPTNNRDITISVTTGQDRWAVTTTPGDRWQITTEAP